MVRLENLNNISKELENEIPSFGPGDVAVFQMLHGCRIEDAETGKIEVAYGKFSMFCKDTIFDIYARGGKGDTINIGIPTVYDKHGNIQEWHLFFPARQAAKFSGKFELIGDNPEDVDVFKYLWLCNILENNPHRNKRTEARFRMLPMEQKAIPLVKQEIDGEGHVTVTAISKNKKAKELQQQLQTELT